MKKDLTKLTDLSRIEIERIISRAFEFKAASDRGVRRDNQLDGKVVALIFEKPSLRTKVAFEVAASYLGGEAVFLSSEQILSSGQNQRGRESIPDIGRNLERFVDIIVARVYSHDVILQLSSCVSKPVINALCDQHHPTQALADVMAIMWHRRHLEGLKVAFIGDGNNVATSLMDVCATMGISFAVASPEGYEIPTEKRIDAQNLCRENGATLEFLRDPRKAVKNADVVYADTFVSMGQESEKAERQELFSGYQINPELLSEAKRNCLFMHCLPAHRGEEVTDEVMDGPNSIVFDQAECRLHVAKALLSMLSV